MRDVKEITKQLEDGIQKVFTSEEYLRYLKVMSRFHTYSYGNCALILMQKPDASLVAGYKAWQTKFNRHVKKGEKGIFILAPTKRTVTKVNEETGETEERSFTTFRAIPVFDISQTDGQELPQFGAKDLDGKVNNYKKFIRALKGLASVPVNMKDDCDGANGYCSTVEIAIKKGMSEVQTFKTLVHEIAHHLMKHHETEEDRSTKEVEAESVAYVVSQYFGLDTSEYSFPYIAGWANEKDKKVLNGVLSKIQKTSNEIITRCEKAIA